MVKKDFLKAEISFKDGVPLAPNAAPVIMVQGSDFDMGYQYAQQMHQIFGSWALERLKRNFTKAETAILEDYHRQLEKHTPEFIDFFKGIIAGASVAGIDLLYDEVLADNCKAC